MNSQVNLQTRCKIKIQEPSLAVTADVWERKAITDRGTGVRQSSLKFYIRLDSFLVAKESARKIVPSVFQLISQHVSAIHRQQALVVGDQRPRGVDKLLHIHLGLLHFQFRISGSSSLHFWKIFPLPSSCL